MSTTNRNFLKSVMNLAWQFFRQTGKSFSECLSLAWQNSKLVEKMKHEIVKFYFQKVDGTIREAWGTLRSDILPTDYANDRRAKNNTIQVYFDTEKREFRCFKKLNLI